MCSGPYPDVHSQALSRWANTGAHTHCQHFAQVRWFLTRIEESLHSTTPKKGHTWLWNFKELSACFEPVLSIKTRWTHCMCAACGSSESSQSVWSFSISLSPTAQHWDSPPSCPEWPPMTANVCRSINFNLYSIGKIRKYLDRPTVEKLVNAIITSRLDYCNSLMFGIPKDLMSQLQKRQNHAARVITQWRKYDHITPVLVDLHWLPVKQRIDSKILLLTYKALNGLAPAYIRELLTPYIPARTLRSMDNNLLEPPKCRLEYFGKRSFAAAAPVLWNDLPLHIKQSPSVDIFKSRIKTRLFQLAYFIWLCKCMYVYFMLSIMNRLGLTRSYVTCTFASALVSKGQISIWHICLILKLALYKYHIIIIIIIIICNWRNVCSCNNGVFVYSSLIYSHYDLSLTLCTYYM